MNLDDLKHDWQTQEIEPMSPKLQGGKLKQGFRDQIKAFEQDHNPQAILGLTIFLLFLMTLSLLGWLRNGNAFSIMISFSSGGTAVFQIVRYIATRKSPDPGADIKTHLLHTLRQLRWHHFNTYVVTLIGALPMLSFVFVETIWSWEALSKNVLIALIVSGILALSLSLLIYWYKKRFLYDTVQLKKEIQSILSEYTIK